MIEQVVVNAYVKVGLHVTPASAIAARHKFGGLRRGQVLKFLDPLDPPLQRGDHKSNEVIINPPVLSAPHNSVLIQPRSRLGDGGTV
ncbi:MAG: hypothetical protein ABSG59_25345, partial [Verrucomicrobiota bacterium]